MKYCMTGPAANIVQQSIAIMCNHAAVRDWLLLASKL